MFFCLENKMKNSFERATSSEQLEESKKKLKAFRSEIYNTIGNSQEKKNAFTINREESSPQGNASRTVNSKTMDNKRDH